MEVNGGELFEKIRKVWPQTKIIVSSADIVWCQKFNGVADMVLEKPIVNMAHFLDQVQSMMAEWNQTNRISKLLYTQELD